MQKLSLVHGKGSKMQPAFQKKLQSIFTVPGKAQMRSVIWFLVKPPGTECTSLINVSHTCLYLSQK